MTTILDKNAMTTQATFFRNQYVSMYLVMTEVSRCSVMVNLFRLKKKQRLTTKPDKPDEDTLHTCYSETYRLHKCS